MRHADVPRARPGAFWRLVRSEMALIAGRRRNQVGILILASVPLILAIAVWHNAPEPGRGPAFFSDITLNGMFVAITALMVQMPLFLPLAVAAVSGDAVAGEAGGGTLRYVLTVPVGRTRLLLAKYLAALAGVAFAVLVVVGTGLLAGLVLFGAGPVPTLSGFELTYGEGVLRVLGAAAYATAALAAVLALGILISTLTEQPIAAMIAVVIVTMAMQIVGSLPQTEAMHPYLIVTHWTAFSDVFREPVFYDAMLRGLVVFACYIAGGLALAIWRFRTKDITS
ncbi:MAG: ABC transporter permease [Mobilicoccus sp.]|nr:ABC transporter permease [Mobilicoccus sp.]